MMTWYKKFWAYFAFVVLSFACSEKDKNLQVSYIPEKASNVIVVDMDAILTQIGKEKLMDLSIFSDFSNQDSATKAMIEKIDNSGVDIRSKFYFFTINIEGEVVTNPMDFAKTIGYVLILPLKNSEDFEKFLNENGKGSAEEAGDKKYFVNNDGLSAMWDKKTAMLAFGNVDQKSLFLELFEKKSTITTNKYFSKLIDEDFDIAVFGQSSPEDIARLKTIYGFSSNLDWVPAFTSTSAISFKKGKMEVKGKYYLPEDFTKESVFSEPFSKGFLSTIPESKPIVTLAFKVNPKVIGSILKKEGLEASINQNLTLTNKNLDQVLEVFSGDIAIALGDLSSNPALPVSVYAQLGVDENKKKEFTELSQNLLSFGSMFNNQSSPNYFTYNGFHFVPTESRMAITNNEVFRDQVMSSSKGEFPKSIAEFSKEPVFLMDVDFSLLYSMVNSTLGSFIGSDNSQELESVFSKLGKLTVVTEERKGNEMNTYGEWTLKDDSQNFLLAISDILKEVSEMKNKQPTETEETLEEEELYLEDTLSEPLP